MSLPRTYLPQAPDQPSARVSFTKHVDVGRHHRHDPFYAAIGYRPLDEGALLATRAL